MLQRLRSLGIPVAELKGVYTSFTLPKLIYASPAWPSSLNLTQQQLVKVKKRACKVILGPACIIHDNALSTNLHSIFLYIKKALVKGKQKHVEQSRLSPDPVNRTVGENKHGVDVEFNIIDVLTLLFWKSLSHK